MCESEYVCSSMYVCVCIKQRTTLGVDPQGSSILPFKVGFLSGLGLTCVSQTG